MTQAAPPMIQDTAGAREQEIQEWIARAISKVIQVDAADIDLDVSFERYGLDSAAAVELTGDLERWLVRKLPPTLLYDYSTIRAVSAYLAVGG